MSKKLKKTLAGRLTRKALVWLIFIVIGVSFFVFRFAERATHKYYSESYHNKMLITYEYTRRVLSDVYVAVTNNVYYIEEYLDHPDSHKNVMERIVKNGTRVRSCGISFIKDYYYPEKGHHFCPFAWRNPAHPDIVWKEDMGDADLDYFEAEWFRSVIDSDSAYWSDPFYDGYDEKTTLAAYMVPIHDKEGNVVAALGADVSLDWLTSKLIENDSKMNKENGFLSKIEEQHTSSFIINHDGTFITHQEESRILKDNFFNHLEASGGSNVERLVADMKQDKMCEGDEHEKFLYDNKECYVFYTPVKYTDWTLVSIVPCKPIDTMGIVNGSVFLFILVLAMLAILALFSYFIKRETRPLLKLAKAADDIAKHKFDTLLPDIKNHDEMYMLRESLDNMQGSISYYVKGLEHTAKQKES